MTRNDIRLELVKICYRHDRSPDQNLAAMIPLEKFILEARPEHSESSDGAGKPLTEPQPLKDNAQSALKSSRK